MLSKREHSKTSSIPLFLDTFSLSRKQADKLVAIFCRTQKLKKNRHVKTCYRKLCLMSIKITQSLTLHLGSRISHQGKRDGY